MKIDIVETSGFCAGVRNALRILDEALSKNKDKSFYCFEDIVHNSEVVEKYKKLGLKKISIDELDKIDRDNSIIILSAHGSSNKLKERLKGYKYIDSVCPFVIHNQEIAKSSKNVLYIGTPGHAETKATIDDLEIVTLIDGEDYIIDNNINYTVINQTTYNQDILEKMHTKIKEINPNNNIIKTLCPTTIKNQNSVKNANYSKLLIVGSKHSNNLSTLYSISKIKDTYIIDDFKVIDSIPFKSDDTVLIIGSASTDPTTLVKLKEKLINLYN